MIAQNVAMRYEHEIDTVDLLLQYGNTTRLQVISAQRLPASAEVARQLEITEGKDSLRLYTLRLEEPSRQPLAVTEITGVLAAAEVMIVLVAALLPLPAPVIVTRLLTVTFSV